VNYEAILSRPGNGWHGLQGYVQHHIEDALRVGKPLDVYVSGMRAMVEEVRGILEKEHFDSGSIHYERHA
jgi:NAD(P)H-flavin reductase